MLRTIVAVGACGAMFRLSYACTPQGGIVIYQSKPSHYVHTVLPKAAVDKADFRVPTRLNIIQNNDPRTTK
jgi:hypothetical protein